MAEGVEQVGSERRFGVRFWKGLTFSFPPQFAEAVLGYQTGWMRDSGIYQAIVGRGGGLAAGLASLFRFWEVAVSKNASRAPVRPLNLSLTIERILLAAPNSASIFLRSPLEAASASVSINARA